MATADATPAESALSTRLTAGVAGGLAGGVVFGLLMQMMGMMPMVGMLVGTESAGVGWIVHLAISAFIGITYAVLFNRWATGPGAATMVGIGYGMVWWVLGGLILMPARLGMGVLVFGATAWQSLMGHVIYGLLLGLVYSLMLSRARGG